MGLLGATLEKGLLHLLIIHLFIKFISYPPWSTPSWTGGTG